MNSAANQDINVKVSSSKAADLNVNNQKIKPFQDLSYTFLRK